MGRTLCGHKSIEREKQERIGRVELKVRIDKITPTIFIPAHYVSLVGQAFSLTHLEI